MCTAADLNHVVIDRLLEVDELYGVVRVHDPDDHNVTILKITRAIVRKERASKLPEGRTRGVGETSDGCTTDEVYGDLVTRRLDCVGVQDAGATRIVAASINGDP